MDSSIDDKNKAKALSSPKSSGTLLGRLPLKLGKACLKAAKTFCMI